MWRCSSDLRELQPPAEIPGSHDREDGIRPDLRPEAVAARAPSSSARRMGCAQQGAARHPDDGYV